MAKKKNEVKTESNICKDLSRTEYVYFASPDHVSKNYKEENVIGRKIVRAGTVIEQTGKETAYCITILKNA